MNRLELYYENVIRPDLISKLNIKNVMDVPKIEKIVISLGVKEAVNNREELLPALLALEYITKQKAIVTKSKRAISGFKLRKDVGIGCKVTLRGDNLYYFLDNFINIVLPRKRDLNVFSLDKFDGKGNYNLGVDSYLLFPEIEYESMKFNKRNYGMNISITTSCSSDLEGQVLLSSFHLPFKVA